MKPDFVGQSELVQRDKRFPILETLVLPVHELIVLRQGHQPLDYSIVRFSFFPSDRNRSLVSLSTGMVVMAIDLPRMKT